jgi:multiple sugar transport system permease protein
MATITAQPGRQSGEQLLPRTNERQKELKRLGLGLLFISPWLVHFLVFQLWPMLASIYYSLTAYSVLKPPVFIGLQNYAVLLTDDPRFAVTMYNTIYYTIGVVGVGTVSAILLALLLNMKVWGQAAYRTIMYLPSVVPLVATSIVFLWFLNPQYGVLNSILGFFGLPTVGWLSDPVWAKPSLIMLALWGLGGAVVIYLAGLQDVPTELYEAADIDGAGWWSRFWNVTLPMLSPVILYNVVVGIIAAMQTFAQIYILTAGGPADSTLMYAYYLYISAFQFFKMGYASAMAWILFLIVFVATFIVFRTSARLVYYGGDTR